MQAAELIAPEVSIRSKTAQAKTKQVSLGNSSENAFQQQLNETIRGERVIPDKPETTTPQVAEGKDPGRSKGAEANPHPDSAQLLALMNSVLAGRPINLSLLGQESEVNTDGEPAETTTLTTSQVGRDNGLASRESLLLQGIRELLSQEPNGVENTEPKGDAFKGSMGPISLKSTDHPASLAVIELQKLLSQELEGVATIQRSAQAQVSSGVVSEASRGVIAGHGDKEALLLKVADLINEQVLPLQEDGLQQPSINLKSTLTPLPEKIAFDFNRIRGGERMEASDRLILSDLRSTSTPENSNENTSNSGNSGQQEGGGDKILADAKPLLNSEQKYADLEKGELFNSLSATGKSDSFIRLPSGTTVSEHQIISQVADQISLRKNNLGNHLTLRLHPEELGELKLEIRMERDSIKAHIITQNPQVQEMLERQIPRLREALEQNGMQLEHLKVSLASDHQGSEAFFQENFHGRHLHRPENTKGALSHSKSLNEPITNDNNALKLSLNGNSLSVHI
ncbi:MAG: flagellar hook-length control protein FliK [Desulfobulbaceae bacterium]|nr:flagellar hook-length control protein FliK [Desulfobulbaceae bacterium]